MNAAVATGSALGAAALFATGSAVQAKALREAPHRAARPEGHFATVIRALRSTYWMAGTAVAAVALCLHALALHEGDLILVQPMLVTMVMFALPAARILGGPRPDWTEYAWTVVLILGLAAFLAAADPTSAARANVDTRPAAVMAVLAVVIIAVCVAAARRREGTQGAALLGASAGIAFAGGAALLKTVTQTVTSGVMSLLTGWQVYALLVVGGAGLVLSQIAYRVGPLSASLPALNSVNPLASVLIGVAVYDERMRTGVLPSSVEAAGLVAVTVAVIILSRTPRSESRPQHVTATSHNPPVPDGSTPQTDFG